MRSYKILLADDHALFREGVKRILESEPGLQVVGEASDGSELMELLRKSLPDLVILDISMPRLDGLKALKEIKTIYQGVKVLILTMYKSAGELLMAFSSKADGYLWKGNVCSDLFNAIDNIREGKTFISNLMSNQIIELFCKKRDKWSTEKALTPREMAVLELLCKGESGKQIAERLSLSMATIYNERASLKKKLNIGTTAGLVKYALEQGIVSAELDLS